MKRGLPGRSGFCLSSSLLSINTKCNLHSRSMISSSFEFVTQVCLWVISLLLVRVVLRKVRARKSNLPPSPPALPIIGHMHLLSRLPHQAFDKLSRRYGPLILLYIGSNPCVIVSSQDVAKEILKTKEGCFLGRPKLMNADYLTYGSSDMTFAPYGPYWKFIKKLCMTKLLGGPTLDLLRPIRTEEINNFLGLLLRKATAKERVVVGAELVRMTNNIICRMALSRKCSEDENEGEEVRELVKEMTELAGKLNLSEAFWFCRKLDLQGMRKRLKDAREKYDSMMERIMREHVQVKKMDDEKMTRMRDLLDILLEIHEDEDSEIRLTRSNIKAFIMNIFGAGTDTSATTVEWALAELINHPDVMEKARCQIDTVVGHDRIVEESDIPRLPYLQAVIKETLRLHPTGPLIARKSTEDCNVSGYLIPVETRVFINVWSLGREPNSWEDPLRFWPERFLNEEGTAKSNLDLRGQSYQLLPFGSGRRSCPGASLALHVIHTTLAAMIQCFDWELMGESGEVNMEEAPGISLPMANPFVCIPVTRLDPFPALR